MSEKTERYELLKQQAQALLTGEFDLDSPEYNTFDDVDAKYLSEIAPIVFCLRC